MSIKLTDKLEAVTVEGVIADASQIKGGYMSVARKEDVKDSLKVIGMLIYDQSDNTHYRWLINKKTGAGEWFRDSSSGGAGGGGEAFTPDLKYELAENETSYTCVGIGYATALDITFATVIEGLPVTAVAPGAFKKNPNIKSITFSKYITTIGKGAFEGCSELTEVYIPKTVINIEADVFKDCPNLKIYTEWISAPTTWTRKVEHWNPNDCPVNFGTEEIPDTVDYLQFSEIKDDQNSVVAYICTGLDYELVSNISIPKVYNNFPVKQIAERAFANNTGLESIYIPDTVEVIGDKAFAGCSALTINTSWAEQPAGWVDKTTSWNPDNLEVLWNQGEVVQADLNEIRASLEGYLEPAAIKNKFTTIDSDILAVNDTVSTVQTTLDSKIDAESERAIDAENEITADLESLSTKFGTPSQTKEETSDNGETVEVVIPATGLVGQVELAHKRIDQIIASDTDDAATAEDLVAKEVQDMRIGHDGLRYTSAGEALRTVGAAVAALDNDLADFKDAEAVGGLLYENSKLFLTTADGTTIGEPVTITEGSGGGGGGGTPAVEVDISLRAISNTTVTTVLNDKTEVKITYLFSSVYKTDKESTGEYICTIAVNSVNKFTQAYEQIFEDGVALPNTIDIASILAPGDNKIKVTCTDMYGYSRSIIYNIKVLELVVASTFNPFKVYSVDEANSGIPVPYKVTGLMNKTVYFILDKDTTAISSIDLAASTSGELRTLYLPVGLSIGAHTLSIYATAIVGDSTEPLVSNIVDLDILVHSETYTKTLISSSCNVSSVERGGLLSVSYFVYAEEEPKKTYIELWYDTDDLDSQNRPIQALYSTQTYEVMRTTQTWSTRNLPSEAKKITVVIADDVHTNANRAAKSHSLSVTEPTIVVEPVTEGLKLFLTAQDKNNSQSNYNQWEYTDRTNPENPQKYSTTFDAFNWSSNGWVADKVDSSGKPTADSSTVLRLSGSAQAVINMKPFSSTQFTASGFTFEIDFAVHDVSDRDTIIFHCFDGVTTDEEGNRIVVEEGHKGIIATADRALIKSVADTVSCYYKDDERIKVTFTIEPPTTTTDPEATQFLSVYLNGVLSGIVRYTANNFIHDSVITLGDPRGGSTLDIYSIRIYNKALTARQIVNNYIADITDLVEKDSIYTDNNIYNTSGKIDYEKVKKKVPTITFVGEMPKYKGDKRKVYMDFENPFDPSKNFLKVYGGPIMVEIDVQGTSSQYYVRKNWKIKLKDKKDTFNHAAYLHMNDEVPAKVFCIKVDYAEATGTHNTQNANLVETFYDDLALLPPQKADDRVRTTITGFPCVIFEKKDDTSDPVFSSKGNFNFDKDAEEAFGFGVDFDGNDSPDYDTECWEFCNNTSAACNFLGEIPEDWLDDFEPRYTAKNFGALEDLEDKDSLTEAEEAQRDVLRRDIIARFKEMHDWVRSTKNNLQKFKDEFRDWFDFDYACIYYVYTFFALMTDQRAKNMFLTYWRDYDEDGKVLSSGKWYPYFYDNDTSFGINNEGHLAFDYFHEDTDRVDGTNVYNGQNSVLWNNFREAFSQEIRSCYASLRSRNKITYNNIINTFITEGSSRWSASIYNEDAEYKYVTMARPANAASNTDSNPEDDVDETGKLITSNLYQVRGDGEAHLKYFIRNRIKYCDSKWNAGDYPNNYILFRVNTPQPITDKPNLNVILSDPNKQADEQATAITLIAGTVQKICFVSVTTNTASENVPNVEDSTKTALITYTCTDTSGNVLTSGELECGTGDNYYVVYPFTPEISGNYKFIISKVTDAEGKDVNVKSYLLVEAEEADLSDADRDINAIIDKSTTAVPPNPTINVKPYSTMYCGVKYKANGTLLQARTERDTVKSFGSDIEETFNDTETVVLGASEISSIGDLSALYCSIVDVSAAGKLTELKVGSSVTNYRNTMLREVKTEANPLLKRLDLTNCVRLQQPINVENCNNIEEIYAWGTSVPGVTLPGAGYLKTLYLPSTTANLIITNQPMLEYKNLVILDGALEDISEANRYTTQNAVSNIAHLCITGCNALNTTTEEPIYEGSVTKVFVSNQTSSTNLLKLCLLNGENSKLTHVRLDNVSWIIRNEAELNNLKKLYKAKSEGGFGLRGLSADGKSVDNTRLTISGTCTLCLMDEDDKIKNVSGSDIAEIKLYMPNLDIKTAGGCKIESIVTFKDDNGNTIETQEVETDATGFTCPSPAPSFDPPEDSTTIHEWEKAWEEFYTKYGRESTPKYDYEFVGWSRMPEKADRTSLLGAAQDDALTNILGDRVLYPAYKSIHRSYNVSFYTGDKLLYTTQVLYENQACFNTDLVSNTQLLIVEDEGSNIGKLVPAKQGTQDPDAYEFIGWYPSNLTILNNSVFYAQFVLADEDYSGINLTELDHTITDADITATKYLNTQNVFAEFATAEGEIQSGTYRPADETLSITTICGKDGVAFSNTLEALVLPDTLKVLGPDVFIESPIQTLHIGKNVETLYKNVVYKCSDITTIHFNAENAKVAYTEGKNQPFVTYSTGYSDLNNLTFIVGPDVKTINPYLCYNTAIRTIDFSSTDSLTTIDSNSFYGTHCSEILWPKEFKNSVTINNNAFYNNQYITDLVLPNNIISISNSAFGGFSKLKYVELPESLVSLAEGAFRYCPVLDTFKVPTKASYPYVWDETNKILSDKQGVVYFVRAETPEALTKCTSVLTRLGNYALTQQNQLTSLIIPETVTSIGVECFRESSISELVFEGTSSLGVINGQAFENCKNLKTIDLPNSLSSIKYSAFASSGLTRIVIPSSVGSNGALDTRIFNYCTDLEFITFESTNQRIFSVSGQNNYASPPDPPNTTMFRDCSSLKAIKVGWTHPINPEDYLSGYEFKYIDGDFSLRVPCCWEAPKKADGTYPCVVYSDGHWWNTIDENNNIVWHDSFDALSEDIRKELNI